MANIAGAKLKIQNVVFFPIREDNIINWLEKPINKTVVKEKDNVNERPRAVQMMPAIQI